MLSAQKYAWHNDGMKLAGNWQFDTTLHGGLFKPSLGQAYVFRRTAFQNAGVLDSLKIHFNCALHESLLLYNRALKK